MRHRLLALLLLALPLATPAKDWHVDTGASSLGFSDTYQGERFEGVFKRFDAAITYDPAHLDKAKFDVSVDLASVDTQSSERDESLTGSDFFAVDRFPNAHFVTRTFTRQADGSVTAMGTLTLRGTSKPVTLKVTFQPTGAGATLDVATTLDRMDFGLGSSDDWADVGRQVSVHGHLVLR